MRLIFSNVSKGEKATVLLRNKTLHLFPFQNDDEETKRHSFQNAGKRDLRVHLMILLAVGFAHL